MFAAIEHYLNYYLLKNFRMEKVGKSRLEPRDVTIKIKKCQIRIAIMIAILFLHSDLNKSM
ncbi:hypothetical protein D3P07_00825 [Paenibacillus sp. 1011MAR3C5]|nr:hypothetical protein D3P07_00825 [Paenibacillus sp. 1011MAR3C5]